MISISQDEYYLLQKESDSQSLNLWFLNPKKDKMSCILKINTKKSGVSFKQY